jgi:sec-independent protein translocase protein TatB
MDFLGVGAGELLVIATIALIVVGPKDLPIMLHKLGRFTARMRGMAAEFRASFDEMARHAELDELRKEIEGLKAGRLSGLDEARADVEGTFRAIDQDLVSPGVSSIAPVAAHAHEMAVESVTDLDGPAFQPAHVQGPEVEPHAVAPYEADERLK